MSSAGALATSERWVATSGGHTLHVKEVQPHVNEVQPHVKEAQPQSGGGETREAPRVLFIPGLFSDGELFLSKSGQGPATTFLENGFVAYVASLRGHGQSRWPARRTYDWNFDTYVRHDIPDLVRSVSETQPGPLFLLAHSMAGYAALAALGTDPSLQDRLAGVVTLSSAVNDYSDGGFSKRAQVSFAALLSRVAGRFPARALRQGRYDEPPGLMRQFADWAPAGEFRSADGKIDYWDALGQVALPVLVGIGAGDTFHASPARARKLADHLGDRAELDVFGRQSGLTWDPGHFDLIRGSRAQEQVLPRVVAWMHEVVDRPTKP